MREPKPTPEEILDHLRRGLGEAFEYAFVNNGRVVCRVRNDAWVEAVRFVREDPALGCSFFSWLSAIDWTEAGTADADDAEVEEQAAGEESENPGDREARDLGETSAPPNPPEPSEAPAAKISGPDEAGIAPYFQPAGELFEVCCHLSAPERGFGVTLKTAVDKERPSLPSLTPVVRGADWHERECHEMFGVDFEGHPNLAPLYLPEDFEGNPLRKSFALGARAVKPWPGIVDVEEIPPDLEPELEARARGEDGA